jgi:hypothetical protein
VSCPGSQINCGGTCINPQTDRGYCGASGDCQGANDGNVCVAGQVCSNGSCAVTCPGTQVNCGGTCVNAQTDRAYCGASGDCTGPNDGAACAMGQVCNNGTCQVSCPAGQINCNGTCVDPTNDRGYCGAYGSCEGTSDGTQCAAGQVCSNGICRVSCAGNQINCGEVCIDPSTNRGYCGASGNCVGANDGTVCDPGQVCSSGLCQLSCGGTQIKCGGGGGQCVEPSTDRTFCGAIGDCTGANDGTTCQAGQVCSNGACVTSCGGSQIICGGSCVEPSSDRGYCGAAGDCDSVNPAPGTEGTACASGQVCSSGTCTTSCLGTQVLCGGKCVDPQTDRGYCGASGDCDSINPAPGTAGTACVPGQVCSAGSCNTSCLGTQVLCGGRCVDPQTDRGYCGASGDCDSINPAPGTAGASCPSGQVCSSAVCTTSCPDGQVNCGGTCIDPTSDRIHCNATTGCGTSGVGSAGTDCSLTGQVCTNSACVVSCPIGQVNCGGTCINPNTDPSFCGATGLCGAGGNGSPGANCASTVGAGAVCSSATCGCPSGQVSCAGTCIDPSTNRTYCGAAGDCAGLNDGTDCALIGQICVSGGCAVTCPSGQVNCGGTCIDPTTNEAHCGATGACGAGGNGTAGASCAISVGAGAVCSGSACSCPNGGVSCGASCIDPATSQTFCGANTNCAGANDGEDCALTGKVCTAGVCQVTCPGAQVNCGGVCVDPQTDGTHCGASGACSGAAAGTNCSTAVGTGAVCSGGICGCPSGQVACGGACIDPNSNRTYCGASGSCAGVNIGEDCSLTGEMCVAGACQVSCPGSQISCGGVCVDPQTSAIHCGASGACSGASAGAACGTTVGTGAICTGGTCGCPGGQIACGAACINPSSDQTYCGAVGNCQGANDGENCALTGRLCSSGACAVSCPSGQINCGGNCVAPSTDATHCGAAGLCDGSPGNSQGSDCSAVGQVCTSGSCACGGGLLKCGAGAGTCIDPNSNPTYCGATGACGNGGGGAGATCTANQACVGGSCLTLAAKVVFVTSTVYNGNLGGLAGADAICAARATAGGLGGTFKAWLSDNATSAGSRLTHYPGRYVLHDGTKVADSWTDLTDGTLDHGIDQNEFGGAGGNGTQSTACAGAGVAAYTNTHHDGNAFSVSYSCSSWTSASNTIRGAVGYSGLFADDSWTLACGGYCDLTTALYCIEQ